MSPEYKQILFDYNKTSTVRVRRNKGMDDAKWDKLVSLILKNKTKKTLPDGISR